MLNTQNLTPTDKGNLRLNYGNGLNDIRHRFIWSSIYEVPVGHGRRFNIKSRVLDAMAGGWSAGLIAELRTGTPLSPIELVNNTNSFSDGVRPNVVGDPNSLPDGRSKAQQLAQWFNVNAFNRTASQQPANNLITLSPTFAGLRSQAYNSSDASLLKKVKIHERLELEVRGDFLNVLNQVTFAAPNLVPTNASFGAVTAQMNVPRRIQGMLRLRF